MHARTHTHTHTRTLTHTLHADKDSITRDDSGGILNLAEDNANTTSNPAFQYNIVEIRGHCMVTLHMAQVWLKEEREKLKRHCKAIQHMAPAWLRELKHHH